MTTGYDEERENIIGVDDSIIPKDFLVPAIFVRRSPVLLCSTEKSSSKLPSNSSEQVYPSNHPTSFEPDSSTFRPISSSSSSSPGPSTLTSGIISPQPALPHISDGSSSSSSICVIRRRKQNLLRKKMFYEFLEHKKKMTRKMQESKARRHRERIQALNDLKETFLMLVKALEERFNN